MENIISDFEALSEEEMTKYAGKWIAVLDGKVIKHEKSFKKLYEFIKKNHPGEKPLMGKLPDAVPVVLSLE
ncbi:MAG: DUF5678 domain-containing protein [Candidatus Nanoarchaeia archaeon]